MDIKIDKKPLPGTATKAEVCNMFPNTPAHIIKRYINEAVRQVDNLEEGTRVTLRHLTRNHLETFFETFGYPVGYENFFR